MDTLVKALQAVNSSVRSWTLHDSCAWIRGLARLLESVSQYNPEICHGRHCSSICQNLTQRQPLPFHLTGSKPAITTRENAGFHKKMFSDDVRLLRCDTIGETGGIEKRDTSL
jgi:hypothetical protein